MRVYVFIMMIALVLGACFAGCAVGRAKSKEKCTETVAVQYVQTVKQMEKINEQTNHTAVRDIRRILHERYTIAQ